MLHLILKEGTVYGSDEKVAVAIMLFGRESSLDHIQQRTGTGYCFYRTVEGFPGDADEKIRMNDAIAISDEFNDDEIAKVIDEYANQVPILIMSAGREVRKRDRLGFKLFHPSVTIVDPNFYALT